MNKYRISPRAFCLLGGTSGILGVLLLVLSFFINPGPPSGATVQELLEFGHQHIQTIRWGGWLQAVGPVFIVLFAFTLVYLSGATARISGWMTMFGASVLMTVSLIEITFYFGALFEEPSVMGPVGMDLINAVQHLYFIVAAPALFIPLGFVLSGSNVLPPILGLAAIALGILFALIGILTLQMPAIPMSVTSLGGIQVFWWLTASGILIFRARKIHYPAAG